jgi:hypothetical protein
VVRSELTKEGNFSFANAKNSARRSSGTPSKVASDAKCSPRPRAISSLSLAKLSLVKDLVFCSGVDFEEESGVVLEVKSLEDFVGSVTIVHEVAKSPHAKMEKAYRTISLVVFIAILYHHRKLNHKLNRKLKLKAHLAASS